METKGCISSYQPGKSKLQVYVCVNYGQSPQTNIDKEDKLFIVRMNCEYSQLPLCQANGQTFLASFVFSPLPSDMS